MSTRVNVHVDVNDRVTGEHIGALVRLWLDNSTAVIASATPRGAAYLRQSATEFEQLADAIDARLAEQAKPEPTCYCDSDLVAPHPFRECPHRVAESTAGETRDVPTPGAAR